MGIGAEIGETHPCRKSVSRMGTPIFFGVVNFKYRGGSAAKSRTSKIWEMESGANMQIPKLDTTPARSAQMSLIRSRDTKPEMRVRKALHGLGFRYRLHVRNLPGCPDIVLPKYGTIIQVKGCFWHAHACRNGRLPKSNCEYWTPKLNRNRERDRLNERKLRRLGWSVYSIWECRLRKTDEAKLRCLLLEMMRSD